MPPRDGAFRALADPTRRRILELLSRRDLTAVQAEFMLDEIGRNEARQEWRDVLELHARPGQKSPIHCHPAADEIYHVLEGEGLFNDGRREIKLGPGATVMPRAPPHPVERAPSGPPRRSGRAGARQVIGAHAAVAA